MNYSPDYSMRYHNQTCGCRQNPLRSMENARQPMPRDIPGKTLDRVTTCGCNKPETANCHICQDTTVRMEASTKDAPCCTNDRMRPACIDTFPVGMTYTPWQVWQELYEIDTALAVGTIFRELDYPWEVGRCVRGR